ncbi:MAG TPA: hypothetical protein VKT83_05310 [bacterium]|nr:hypothetical protein [bacterium]
METGEREVPFEDPVDIVWVEWATSLTRPEDMGLLGIVTGREHEENLNE